MNNLIKNILSDLRVELTEEFDLNYQRKAFFDQPWEKRRMENPRGTLLTVSGRMRRSLHCRVKNSSLVYTSNAPHFNIHNNGGRLPVTPRMRRYFWAMYYKHGGGGKDKTPTAQAVAWRNMALTRKEHFTIPKRQVVGDHPHVGRICEKVTGDQIQRWHKEKLEPALRNFGKHLNRR